MKKYFKLILVTILASVSILIGCSNQSKEVNGGSYPPLIKVYGEIYSNSVKSDGKVPYEKIGEIKHSYNTGTVAVYDTDEDWTCNVFPVGCAIYSIENSDVILVEYEASVFAALKKIEEPLE